MCGDSGQIIGRAVSAVNDSYTSQLVVNVSQSIIGANVECARQSDGMLHIGTEQILLTTGIYIQCTTIVILCTFYHNY